MNKDRASCMMSAFVGVISLRSNGCFDWGFYLIKSIGVVLYQGGILMIYVYKDGAGLYWFLDLRVSVHKLFLISTELWLCIYIWIEEGYQWKLSCSRIE